MSNEQEPAQANTPKEPEVKYVLSGQPTGWWAAAKDVREFDIEKVTSCKEDIDTLLVFAGLFSAVLSAFVVAVYPNLQQPPSDRMIYAIERVAAQTASYRVNLTDGTLIAANIPPPSPPAFQVSDDDIRVNALWFASLIISLVTASFGMLVKQWLREFLASEDPSALHRLRLRHFREPEMKAWMVYEIAGLLPILLHLSLGLFFVGLCYFTSSVHSSIGYTTVPLVVGWALCFFAATALPLFFPRCPYKVAFLKVLIVRLHRLVREFAEWYSRLSYMRYYPFAARVRRAAAHIWAKCCMYMKSLSRAVATAVQVLKGLSWAAVVKDMKRLVRAAIEAAKDIPDEAILVGSTEFDLDILSSVDAIQGNDEMLATIIPEALLYTRPDPIDVVQLVIELLQHRVPTLDPSRRVVEYWPFEDMNPLHYLRPQARDYILSILLGHIRDLGVYGACFLNCFSAASQSPGRICRYHTAVFRALFLVASAPRESLTPNAAKILEQCFEVAYHWPGFWRWLCYDPVTTGRNASQKLKRVLIVIRLVNDLTNTGQIQLYLEHRVAFSTQIPHPHFPSLVDRHIDSTTYPWDTWQLSDSYDDMDIKFSCIVFWLHAASEGLNSLRYETSADPSPLVTSVVEFSLRLFYKWITGPLSALAADTVRKLAYNDFRKMVHIAVKRESTALAFVTMLIDEFQVTPNVEGSPDLITRKWALWSVLGVLAENKCDYPPRQDPAVIKAIFQLATSKMTAYQEQEHGIIFQLGLFQVLAFFLITIYVPPDFREEYRRMFASLANCLLESHSQASPHVRDELRMSAQCCLGIMEYEDRGFGKSDCPRSEEDSIFPDTFLEILLTLIGERGHTYLPRTPKTQPAIEPGPTSAAVMNSASTSDQGIDTSELVQSTSGGEPQPAYAMQDVEQTKAAHEEEGNDIYV